jgi:phosphinothricin acetyltransferase
MISKTPIRSASVADLPAINDIYNYYVANSNCTYDQAPLSPDDRRRWFESHGAIHPVIVAEIDGEVVAFGALSPFRPRSGFRFTAENAVYVRHDLTGRGIGTAMLNDLLDRARQLGYRSIIAVIDAGQSSSIRLHERHGFARCAHLHQAGFKFGKWLDVIYLELLLPADSHLPK